MRWFRALMSLISLNDVSLRYGAHVLLDSARLQIAEGDRLAIIGRNGCGKTSLLKIIAGVSEPDSGLVERSRGLSAAYLPQEVPVGLSGSVYSVVASGLGETGRRLARYRELLPAAGEGHSAAERAEFDALLHFLDESAAWPLDRRVEETVERLELSADAEVGTLSAGLRRRALLGRGLVSNPGMLILDEPTNHLDIDSVVWLEKFLKSCGKTLVFVSHDRAFLRSLSTRVAEVDRGRIVAFDCGFDDFLARRDALLEAEERNCAVFDKKLAQEEAWLRQGVKARRTRNEGRVRELMKLREARRARRGRQGVAELRVQEGQQSGRKVMEVKNLGVSYSGRAVIRDFSTTIYSGDKIGVIGRNGAGKTTLLNALLGRIRPDSGEVLYGTNLQVAYFDQLRSELDPEMSPFEFVGGGGDFVEVNSRRQNVMGYLQGFLFAPEQIRGRIGMLSGGEKNRLMLAKLLTRPANVLVLDEPTNDLDMETMDILESALVGFSGTVLLVSHDRAFLNEIVTGLFCFDEGGEIVELVGGYDEWEAFRARRAASSPEPRRAAPAPAREKPRQPGKFTNRERRELEEIPVRIAELEEEQAALAAKLQDAAFIIANPGEIPAIEARLAEIEREDAGLFERWAELDARREAGAV